VLAALLHREHTGEGQRVEVPMIDVLTAFTLVEHAGAATAVPPQGPPGYPRILNPERQPQRTADGWINVLAYTRKNYEDLFREGGRPDLADDERIAGARSRIAHADSLYRDVAAVLTRRTTDEWLTFCAESQIPASPVPTLEELVDALPEDDHPLAGRYKVIPQPVRFSAFDGPTVHRPAALSGQHTAEVLAEVAAWPGTGGTRPEERR
jgi:crotonobetainyl-CoA:carnitine CoA-transferase CaiB-like acyl-CoA transferase